MKIHTLYVLGLAVMVEREFGFVRAHDSSDTPSVARLRARIENGATPDQEALIVANDIIEWRKQLSEELAQAHNDYLDKAVTVLSQLELDSDTTMLPLIASLPSAYRRWQKRQAPIEDVAGEWFEETIGERIEFIWTIGDIRWFNNKFGQSALTVGTTQDGKTVCSWISDNSRFWETHPDVGTSIAVRATIKDKTLFRGKRQTVVSRVKMI